MISVHFSKPWKTNPLARIKDNKKTPQFDLSNVMFPVSLLLLRIKVFTRII